MVSPDNAEQEVVVGSGGGGNPVMALLSNKQLSVMVVFQILAIVLYGVATDHPGGPNASATQQTADLDANYWWYMHVHMMVFMGVAYLFSGMNSYRASAVGYNLMIGGLVVQYTMLGRSFFQAHLSDSIEPGTLNLDVAHLLNADYGALAVGISMGAVMGCCSLFQLFIMAVLEVVFFTLNDAILLQKMKVMDNGGNMYIHVFAAVFGIGAARMVVQPERAAAAADGMGKTSHARAMFGTVLLWLLFPSFNAVSVVDADMRHRVVVNTVLALSNSVAGACVWSRLLRGEDKFSAADAQRASLAGGVMMSGATGLLASSWIALLMGFLGGLVVILADMHLRPRLADKGFHDSMGVMNLHGWTGIFAACVGMILMATTDDTAPDAVFGKPMMMAFPAMVPVNPLMPHPIASGRTGSEMAQSHLAALGISVAMAMAGGLVAGFVARTVDKDGASPYGEDSEMVE